MAEHGEFLSEIGHETTALDAIDEVDVKDVALGARVLSRLIGQSIGDGVLPHHHPRAIGQVPPLESRARLDAPLNADKPFDLGHHCLPASWRQSPTSAGGGPPDPRDAIDGSGADKMVPPPRLER